jgi:peptidoglycan/LPS O-acetylase OafA/YrhL
VTRFKTEFRLSSSHSNNFDLVRLILATLVMFEHAYYLPFNSPVHEPLFQLSGGQLDFGALAVNFFFVVSGFLVTRSWLLSQDAGRYFKKRAARILPGFFTASAIGVIVAVLSAPDWFTFLAKINARAAVAKVISLHPSEYGAFPHNPMPGITMGTLWSIRYEFDCYVVVAALGLLGLLGRASTLLILVVSVAALIAQRFGYLEMPCLDHGALGLLLSNPTQWPRLLSFFFAGAAFYCWRDAIPRSFFTLAVAVIMIAFAARYGGLEFILIVAGSYCLFFFALSAPVMKLPADISYGLYLFGFPTQQAIIALGLGFVPFWLFALSFPIACLVAFASWTFIESPFLRRSKAKRQDAPRPAAPSLPVKVGS